MMTMEIHSVGSTDEELADRLERLAKLLRGGKADMDERLLGLDLDYTIDQLDKGPKSPCRWRVARPGEASEDVLLTLRRDLLAARRRLLEGAGRRTVLLDLDYTIDQLDNALGEM